MSVETHRVLIGACDWNHPAWLDDFYSEDLPEDWRLGFYSNEFPVVYVSAAQWINNEDSEEWSEDVSDSFRFILEIPYDVLIEESRFASVLIQVKNLGEFCLGLVFQIQPSIDMTVFKKHLDKAQELTAVCVNTCGIPISDELSDILKQQNVSEVWDGESADSEKLKQGALAITHISGEKFDMTALRNVIEGCLAASTEDRISVLCIDGNPPSLELLRNADIILNLL